MGEKEEGRKGQKQLLYSKDDELPKHHHNPAGQAGREAMHPGTSHHGGRVLGWLAAGMTHHEIIDDYPELTEEDIRACLAYAADRERRLIVAIG